MRTRFLVAFVVLTQALVAAQEEERKPLEDLEPHVAELRKGAWSEERANTVIGGLLSHDQVVAAAWWLEEAESMLARRKLPASAKRSLGALEKKLRARAGTIDPEAFKLSGDLAKHALDVVNKKNYQAAGDALVAAEDYVAFFASRQAEKQIERARKRLAAAKSRSDYGHKVLLRQQEKTNELTAAAHRVLQARWRQIAEAYRCYGNFRSYARVCRLVRVACPKDDRASALAELRKVTLAFHAGEDLTLWVIGLAPLKIVLDGQEIGSQSEMWRGGSWDRNPPWKPLTVPVLPGDRIEMRGPDNEASRRMARLVMVHARLGQVDLPKSCFRAMAPDDRTRLGAAQFGTIADTSAEQRSGGDHVPKRGVRFEGESVEELGGMPVDLSFVPVPDPVFAWFEKHRVPFTCAQGSADRPILVLVVPGVEE